MSPKEYKFQGHQVRLILEGYPFVCNVDYTLFLGPRVRRHLAYAFSFAGNVLAACQRQILFRWIAGSVLSDHGPRGAAGLKRPP